MRVLRVRRVRRGQDGGQILIVRRVCGRGSDNNWLAVAIVREGEGEGETMSDARRGQAKAPPGQEMGRRRGGKRMGSDGGLAGDHLIAKLKNKKPMYQKK